MSSCRVIKTVFNLNFRDESTVPILAGGILASGFVVLIVIILYVKRRKISRWKSDVLFCLNYPFSQAHCFVLINKQRNYAWQNYYLRRDVPLSVCTCIKLQNNIII